MRKSKILLIVGSIIIIASVLIIIKNRITTKKTLSLDDVSGNVEQKILSFELTNYAKNGTQKWILKGDSADILAEVVNLTNINMETYDDPKIILTSLRGIHDRKNKEISLFDDVVVLTSDGARLTTDYLKWNSDTDIITTDKPVRIVRSDTVINGIGAEAFPQMKKIILKEDVKVELARNVIKDAKTNPQENNSPPAADKKEVNVVITCKGPLEMDYQKNIAIFEDDVLVDDKKGKIYSDRMEAYLDPNTKDIVKVIAEGEVRVIQGEDSTYSQKAIYTTEDQKIVLIGKPRIYIRSQDTIETVENGLGGI